MKSLKKNIEIINTVFKKEIIDARNKTFIGCQFLECTFSYLENTQFIDCNLFGSEFNIIPTKFRGLLNLTLTLNCSSFEQVKYSDFMLYCFLFLLSKSRGNVFIISKILEIIPEDYQRFFRKAFKYGNV